MVLPKDGGSESYPAIIQQAYAGTILCDVRSLSARWEDCNNRDVDPDHIEKLKARFRVVGIQRTTEEHRMKATVKQAEWQQLLVVIGENELCQSFHQGSGQTQLSCTFQEVVEDPMQMAIVPRDLPITPILEAGQHRQHALVELLEEKDRIAKSDEGKNSGIKPPTDHACSSTDQVKIPC